MIKREDQERTSLAELPDKTIAQLRPHQDFFYAFIGSLLVSIVCAILWAVITVSTEYQIAYMAIGVGFAVGYATRFFGAGVDQIYGFTGAFFSLFGCLLGNLFSQVGFIALTQKLSYFETLTFLDLTTIVLIYEDTFNPIDLLFYGVAIYEGYRFAFRPVTDEILSGEDFTPPYSKLRLPVVITSIILLSISMFAFSKGVTGEQVLYHDNGAVMSRGKLVENIPEGPWIYYYESGNVQANAHYVNGIETGLWEWFHENGNLMRKGIFKNGLSDGTWLYYAEGGVLIDSSNYVDGRLHGPHKSFFANGQLAQIGSFKRDRNEGPWKYYYENGALRSEGIYKDDLPNGLWNFYRENGSQKEVYDNITKDSSKLISAWDQNGNMTVKNGYGTYTGEANGVLTDQGKIENGLRVGEWTIYHANGQVKTTGRYKDGVLHIHSMWDHQGKVLVSNGNGDFKFTNPDTGFAEERGSIKDGLLNETWTSYYPNSLIIQFELTYQAGILNGRNIAYFENGMMLSEGYMVNDEHDGKWTWYYESGAKHSSVTFKNGKKEGEQFFWSESGIEAKKEVYENDILIEEYLL